MKNYFNQKGSTLVEIIMTISLLGIVICPLMSMFVLSAKISNNSNAEYKSLLQAQQYIEEIKSLSELDSKLYLYNAHDEIYIRKVLKSGNIYEAEIILKHHLNNMYYINVIVMDDGNIINSLEGSVILNNEK